MKQFFILDLDSIYSEFKFLTDAFLTLRWSYPNKLQKLFGCEPKPKLTKSNLNSYGEMMIFSNLTSIKISKLEGRLTDESLLVPTIPLDEVVDGNESYLKLVSSVPNLVINRKYLKEVSPDYVKNWYVNNLSISTEISSIKEFEFCAELHKAIKRFFVGSKQDLDLYYMHPLTRYLITNLLSSRIHLTELVKKDEGPCDLVLDVYCERPGMFIGHHGFTVDWFTEVIRKVVSEYNRTHDTAHKFCVNLLEFHPFDQPGIFDTKCNFNL